MDIDLSRYDEFPPVSRQAYDEAVAKALGARSLDRLVAVTPDGIRVQPLGVPRADCLPVVGRPAGRAWSIVQEVLLDDAGRANAQILDELAGGVDGLDLLVPAGSPLNDAASSSDGDPEEMLVRVFSGVHLDMVEVHFDGLDAPLSIVNALRGIAERGGRPIAAERVFAGFDPYAEARSAPGFPTSGVPRSAEDFRRIVMAAADPGAPFLLASRGGVWHALGASDLQQLAMATATGRAYLAEAVAAGVDRGGLERLAARIEFRLVADQNQFTTMARFRAFRRIWALILDTFGLTQVPARVHAETSWRMMTGRDPWVNILRSTVAVFAAAVSGADSITTRAHTVAVGRPDGPARRLSRNVQAVLLHEANLHRVADPAAGAGALEDLTDAFAKGGFELFREIEREGGIARAMASGWVARRLTEADARERDLVARRRLPVTGVSTYPLPDEARPPVLDGAPPPPPVPGARRLSEPFEDLRARADAALAATGRRPAVFLAALGTPSAHGPRLTWTRNLVAAGGLSAAGGDDADTVAAFRAAGTPVAVLVGDDAAYTGEASAVAAALRAAGATRILLAGRPPADGAFDAASVDGFVHEGLDMTAVLADILDRALAVTGDVTP